MPIYFNENTKEFHLQAKDVSYIFTVLKNNHLGHLYYGKKIQHRPSFSHLFKTQPRAGASCVFEGDLEFSLDSIKQEFPCYGTSDYREPAFQIVQENGSRITNFEYKSHSIFSGKPKLDGLPATYVEDDHEATTLQVLLYDELIDAEIHLLYTVFEKYNVVTRSAKFINNSNQQLQLNRALSMNVDFFDSDYEMIQLSGSWARERHVKTRKLQPGIQSITSTRGSASSGQQNPFIALKRTSTTEFQGEVYGFSLVYSGNFLAQVEVDHYDVARVSLGINPFDFSWLLDPTESFQTPEVVMVYSDQGLNAMSQVYHELYRSRLAKGRWRDKNRPVLINNWEATYFDFNEEKIVEIATASKELGVELFVLDDGWFGKRDDDTTSLGDWYVDEEKLPNGIKGLAEKITALNMEFGLWFEPEMVSKKSQLFKEHPDWLIHVPGRANTHARNQHVLDFSRKEAVDYIYEMMAEILREAPITYVKWDMNRYMTEIGSPALAAQRQREVSHRFILGVYDLYERLTSEFPEVLFESCASGGCRFDPGMLYYAPQTWTSDDTDAVERLKIQYGTSFVYPLSAMGAHVSAVPNHQVHRFTSLNMRGNVAFFGVFGYELDLAKMSDEEKELVKEQIAFYKENRSLFQRGTFYRLLSPFENDGNETSWMVVSEDQTEAIVGYYRVLAKPNPGYKRLLLKGLNEAFEYKLNDLPVSMLGDELMNVGLQLENEYSGASLSEVSKSQSGDFSSRIYKLTAINSPIHQQTASQEKLEVN
ncbi:alpha-galactosidase [Anaerobacillus alkalilacustris]|uniref:Alpha-galactosidase n=1 Tax=Anaerobacillus alkalilacustris TaxID=393763 RepID=A0A1S2LWX0_9BACI|nr:alpha-galactosidase [Anaerobacillus alkalilacustris]OIJ17041.1 alpha-galactosidase [Anaerobacillus alkalilacustris]